VRAAVVGPGGRYEVVSVPDPSPGPGELLLRVTACGLCGSDLKARKSLPAGTIMGHEFAGEIVGVGAGTTQWRAGSHVAVLPVFACGQCQWCKSGYVGHCRSARTVGLGGSAGGFAELAVVTPSAAFPLPPDVEPVHGAFVEPFAVGLHCTRTAGVEQGDDVLVVGAGPVGLTTIAWARAEGARRITAVDPVADRRAAAQSLGATDVLTFAEMAEPGGYDIVLECAGKPGLLNACIAAARTRGRIVIAGVCAEPTPLASVAALLKEVSIGFVVYYTTDEFRAVIDAFASGRIDPSPFLSRRFDLSLVNDAFDDLARTAASAKILIEP
jgi:(R,R)-butanediol dehydrogenase / meso-butanediol dehydrogenase / diacetyl reductase